MEKKTQKLEYRLLSVNEAAKCLGVAPALVVRMAKADILPALLFGRRRKFSTEAIKKFFKEYEGQDVMKVLKEREAKA